MILEAKLKDEALVLQKSWVKKKPENASKEVASPDSEESAETPPSKNIDEINQEKHILELRKKLDEAFIRLDRLLAIAEEKEEEFDFPVAFVTNLLYVCEKNGLQYMLEDANKPMSIDPASGENSGQSNFEQSKRLRSFLNIVKKK